MAMAMTMAPRCVRSLAHIRTVRLASLRGIQTAKPLPEGLLEITSVKRTPSWSLTELHQHGAVVNHNETVLNEAKLLELAELCHLHIDETRLPGLLKDVESILQCTKTIQAVTVDADIDELYANDGFDLGTAPLREDVVTEGDCVEQVLANAAEREGYLFKVPKVLQD